MTRALHPTTENSPITCCARGWAIAVCLLLVPLAVWAQASQTNSLADVARQMRAQKQAKPTADSSQAQQVNNQLSEDPNGDDAPGGFKTYNAGDYRLWVPAPYSGDAHDDTGVVLSGPMVGSKRPIILVGTPMAFQWGDSDAAFQDAATSVARLYSQSATCTKISAANRSAYQCNLAGASLLGHGVSGNAVFVRGARNIYPVFCVAPTESRARNILNNPRSSANLKASARETLAREDQDVRSVWQKCDTVFSSIRLKPEAIQPPSAQAGGSATAPAASIQGGTPSLESPALAAPAPSSAPAGSPAPAGYKVHSFRYCGGTPQCWDASVLVPADAQLISSDCKRYAFETKVHGTAFLLLAGAAGTDCDGRAPNGPDLVRWKQLADPETSRAPGTYSTISSQMTQVDGKPATITTLSFRAGLTEWEGKRVEIESNGVPLVAGCMAPREHFDDGDAVCSTLIASLQLQ